MLVGLLFVSCEKRDNYCVANSGYSETVGFSVVDKNTQTRNALAIVGDAKIAHKAVLRGENSKDSLHLTTYISDMDMPSNMATRASAFNDLSNGFFVYGYSFDDENDETYDDLYINNIKTTKVGATWSFNPSEYWASGQSVFFGYANVPNTVSISTANGAPNFTYNVPTADVTAHKDFIVARSARTNANTANVPLTFYHPLTAVQFEFGTIEANGIIESLSIEGVYLTGELNLGYGSTSDGFMSSLAWTRSNKANFTLAANTTVSNTSTGDIATLANGYALMMIPQQLDGAKLVLMYKNNAESKAIRLEANLTGTWGAGKVVTYKISLDDILDFGFENTTELCLDAHYVMDNQLSIYAKSEVFEKGSNNKKGELIVSSDQDWLRVQTSLGTLQTQGWWIWEERGNTSLSLSSAPEGTRIWLIAEENNSNAIRTATITLTATKTGDTKTFTISQMCPNWTTFSVPITDENGKITGTVERTIGAERIEEDPQLVPWGSYWALKEGKTSYSVTYKASSDFLQEVIALLYYLFTDRTNVEYRVSIFGKDSYVFDYSNVANTVVGGTLNEYDGLSNTTSGYSSVVLGTTALKDYLFQINPDNAEVEKDFDEYNPTTSAFINALKKNPFHELEKEEGGETTTQPNIDKAKEDGDINWYLPAKGEAESGVYRENEKLHPCETPFDPYFDQDATNDNLGTVFWTSTSITAPTAYTFDFISKDTEGADKNTATGYRVRAVRRSN